MAKHNFGIKGVVGEVKEGGGGTNTTPPPSGAYRGILKRLQLSDNSNGDPMLTAVVELKMPKHLKKHDGYWLWERFNLTEQGAPYFNAFLNALAGSETKGLALQKSMWDKGELTTKSEDGGDVLKIGTFTIGSPEGKRPISCSVIERSYTNKNGEEVETVNASRWMAADASLGGGSDDDDDDDDLGDADDAIDGDDLGDEDGDDDLGGDDEEGGEDTADDDAADEDDPEGDEFGEHLDSIEDLKQLRKLARDSYSIPAAETAGKNEEEVRDMIWDSWDENDRPDWKQEDEDPLEEEEQKPAAARRRGRKKSGGEEPPF